MKTLLTTIYHVTKSAKNHEEEEEKRAENPCHSQYIIFMWIDDILKHNHQSSRAKVGMQPREMKKKKPNHAISLFGYVLPTYELWLFWLGNFDSMKVERVCYFMRVSAP